MSYVRETGEGGPTIYVDSREAANRNGKKIVGRLGELGAVTIVRKLDFGDYFIGDGVAIERKTVFDLANTLTQRFLFDQIFEMKEAYPKSLLLIEGYMGLLRKFRRISPESLSGALFTLAQANIPIVPTIDCENTAVFLFTSAKQLLKGKQTTTIIRHKTKKVGIKRQQLFVVAGLPNIGSVIGDNLLRYFKTLRAVFASSKEEYECIEGIGPKIADNIAKILDTPYEYAKEKTAEET